MLALLEVNRFIRPLLIFLSKISFNYSAFNWNLAKILKLLKR